MRDLVVRVMMAAVLVGGAAARGQIVLSGNENKLDLTGGGQAVIKGAAPDSVSVLDFSVFPPKVATVSGVANSVVGPPSNIAISPDGRVALVANSLKLEASAAAGWVPETQVHVMDLTVMPPQVVGEVKTDAQPSGISFTPDGKMALVANRAGGTVTVLTVEGTKVTAAGSVKVCEPAESASDVAISPDGTMGLVSIQKAGVLVVLKIEGGKVVATGRKISVYGQPYRVVFTPDGELALTAGAGYGNGLDQDAVSVVDVKAAGGMKATAFVPVGTTPESFEISPDGRLAAVVVMEGSNTAKENVTHSEAGAVVILERRGRTFAVTQKLPVGRIPEGVAFTGDGKYLLVQCHPDRKIWVFRVSEGKVEDSGVRVEMPGMPSSMRAVMLKK